MIPSSPAAGTGPTASDRDRASASAGWTAGRAPVLAARYDPLKTRDPLIALSANEITGGALHWTYMLFHESTAEYVSALIDPLTGDVTLRP
jgi:hypothetical protein